MKSIRFFFMFLVFIFVIGIYYYESKNSLVHSAEQEVAQTLINHQALRKIVRKHYIPELQRLKEEGTLESSYENPLFFSGTFLTQKLHDYTIPLQLKTGKEATRFNYASLNPLNPLNKASQYEEEIFKEMLGNNLEKFSALIEEKDKPYLFYATYFGTMDKMCLRCHGDPQDAPANQIKRYGSQSGYNFNEGDPSALIIIRSPLEESLSKMNRQMIKISLIILIVFLVLYTTSEWSISHIKNQQKKISKTKNMLNKDPLTGLLNRRKFESMLKKELNRAKRDKKHLVFFFLDIDYFKDYNDTYGHLQGDRALIEVAHALKECFSRSHESVFRLGGEEFGVISSTADIEDVPQWSRNILYTIESKNIEHIKSPFKHVTVSMGINIVSSDHKEIDIKNIIKGADTALYESKEKGRNRATLYHA